MKTDITVTILVLLLASGCAAELNQAPKAPPMAELSIDIDIKLNTLSDGQLDERKRSLTDCRARIESEARSAVDRQLHRIAYVKYLDVQTVLAANIRLLEEVRRRESELEDRVRLGRIIDGVVADLAEVKRMIGLLRLSAEG